MKSDLIREKRTIRAIHEGYEFYHNVPERGLVIDGRPAMTQIDPSKVGDFVLVMVRDPLCTYGGDPAEVLAARLDGAELAGRSGMFTSYTGKYKGSRITLVSGGSGSPEAELLLYDFLEFTDADVFLRVGGSGGIGDDVHPGDIVISSGIMRDEAMTQNYIGAGYPAVCSYDVVCALIQAAERTGHPFHVGVTVSNDSDFVGGGRPYVGGYLQPWNREKPGIYNRAGILNGDRESAAIVTLATLFGRRGGSVCSVADNIITGEKFLAGAGHNVAVDIALEACVIIDSMDAMKRKHNSRNWHPGLV
jgi:uridine phosphorylase